MDGAILVVAALDGPMPQTREHGVGGAPGGSAGHGGVFEQGRHDGGRGVVGAGGAGLRELLTGFGFPGEEIPISRGSALAALESPSKDPEAAEYKWHLAAVGGGGRLHSDAGAGDRQAVSDADRGCVWHQGAGTVVTGRIERGKIKVGEEVEIVGLKDTRKTVVTGVEMFRKILRKGLRGTMWGVCCGG